MDWIVISGVKPYDGRYEFDLGSDLTTREWGWIKRLSGYLPATMGEDAWSDPELACVLAVITLARAGKIERQDVPRVFERLQDAPFGTSITIEVEGEAEDADAGPPSRSLNGSEPTSGDSGSTSSEISPPSPERSGIPGSAFSASPLGTESVT